MVFNGNQRIYSRCPWPRHTYFPAIYNKIDKKCNELPHERAPRVSCPFFIGFTGCRRPPSGYIYLQTQQMPLSGQVSYLTWSSSLASNRSPMVWNVLVPFTLLHSETSLDNIMYAGKPQCERLNLKTRIKYGRGYTIFNRDSLVTDSSWQNWMIEVGGSERDRRPSLV